MTELLNETLLLKDLANIVAWQNELAWQPFRDGVDSLPTLW